MQSLTHYGYIILELVIGFAALFVFTKLVGRNQFSQITPFDFISALILGELIGNAIYDKEVKIWDILLATVVWGMLIFGSNWVTQKFNRLRKLMEGEPSIIVKKGKFQYRAMKKAKIDLNEALMLIRQQGYFSLREVEYAILETNGLVSVLPNTAYAPPTRQDLKLPAKEADMGTALILDGKLNPDNLRETGLDEEWLKRELAKQHVRRYEDVFYAEVLPGNQLYINPY
jgi:uncharacterized membrane protein YcaP (DUF421 family)